MKELLRLCRERTVIFDGGTGTLLQQRGLAAGELPETWNITHPEEMTALHLDYINAGADIIKTNTFGAYSNKFHDDLERIVRAAFENAGAAVEKSGREVFKALDMGPTGKLLSPLGDLGFEQAVEIFARTVRAGAEHADLVLIETMNDLYELKAAVLAAKENCDLPIFATVTFDKAGKLMTGADPAAVVALLEGLGVSALGMNCGIGPAAMTDTLHALRQYASVPIIVNPNAGLPVVRGTETFYELSADDFAEQMSELIAAGASFAGGCCGTTPEHIRKLVRRASSMPPAQISYKDRTVVCSYTHAVEFGSDPVLIGERINPTGKPKLKAALRESDMSYIVDQGIEQSEKGAKVLDVNVGLPEIDEPQMLEKAVLALQEICDTPLQIDTSDKEAMERALRIYNGKPLINSVNGKRESLDSILPLAAKYGGVLIGLTLDENGIPDTVEGRVEIALRIYSEAEKYGIRRKDIIIDPLALAVSSDPSAAKTTLATVAAICSMGGKTSLGVSNISFGLPEREKINTVFFAMALSAGLSAAIMNPFSESMIDVYMAYRALSGIDSGSREYVSYAAGSTVKESTVQQQRELTLFEAVKKGLSEKAAAITESLAKEGDFLSVINGHIVPALDEVGAGFEKKTLFLPQLLAAAEAASAAFDVIKKRMPASAATKGRIILATVKGDIHDIGKNIVKVMLENYGYEVIDLGKDVAPELIAETARTQKIRLVGLSALMTTTVVSMEQTIKLIRDSCTDCKVVVGGAVMTEEYAAMIGADKYAADAMDTVLYAEEIFGEKSLRA